MEADKYILNCTSGDKPKAFTSFKDIRRTTMRDTYQHLQRLLKDTEFQKSESFKGLILPSTSLSLFDESLRIIAIDSLKLENEVIKILLSQNDDQIKSILRCTWFFKALPSQFCTSEIFPHVSFSLRCKIITKLSKYLEDESEAEKYFLFIREKYSNQRADYLLPKCSSQFILSHFQKHQPLFEYPAGNRILFNICRRHPEVGLHILISFFDLKKYSFDLNKYKNVLLYLAGNHTDLFAPIVRKYYSIMGCETFGRKLTLKLGRILKEHLFSDFENTKVFKSKPLFCMLSFEDKVKFLSDIAGFRRETLSFLTWSRSADRMCEMLKLVPANNRLPLIEATFRRLFNLNFNDHTKCWCFGLLELLPVETRLPYVIELEKFFEADRTTFGNNVDDSFTLDSPEIFVRLYACDTAFAKFKEMLRNAPQPSKRQNILRNMVLNYSINADVKGLEEAVNFVAARHRNDDWSVLYGFIETICSEFSWTALNSRIFEKLEDLINFLTVKGSPDPHVHMQWREKHIYRLMEDGVDTSDHVKYFLENVVVRTCYYRFIQDYRCRHSRTLLLAFGEMAVKWIRNCACEHSRNILLHCLLQTCEDFNKAHGESQIVGEIPGLDEILSEKLKAKVEDLGAEKWPLEVWGRYYGDVENARFNPKCLLFVLNRRPDLIESHLEGFVVCLTTYYCKSFKRLYDFAMKAASFFDKTEELKELLLRDFKTGNSIEHRKQALTLYSRISTIEEFTGVAEKYLPKREKVESGSDLGFGQIQVSIPLLIKNVKPRWRNFDLILKFFKGDFLINAIQSLRSCCHHTRVDVVVPFLKGRLEALPDRVSYRKDVIRLIAKLCDRDEKINFCLKCWHEHEHYSIRTVLFIFISEQFVEQPTRESLRVLEKCILESDPTFISRRPNFEKVPDEFLENYVSALFRFSERQTPAFRSDFQQTILSYFWGKKISLLSSDFCEKVIKSNLFNPESRLEIGEFACSYIMADPNAMRTRVRMILDLIRDTKANYKSVSALFNILLRRSATGHFADLVTFLLENWPEFPLGVLYEERLLFTYHSLHQKALRSGPDSGVVAAEFAKELKKLFSGVENLKDLVLVFAEALKSFFVNFKILKAILTVKELVMGSEDRTLAVLGILALPREATDLFREEAEAFSESISKCKQALNELVKIFESYNDEVVEIFLRRKFFG